MQPDTPKSDSEGLVDRVRTPPKGAGALPPGLVGILLTQQRGLGRWGSIKNLKLGDCPGLPRRAQRPPRRPSEREAEGQGDKQACDHRGREWSGVARSLELLAEARMLPWSCQREVALPARLCQLFKTLWTFAFQNCKKISLCRLKPLRLRDFVTAATGNGRGLLQAKIHARASAGPQ